MPSELPEENQMGLQMLHDYEVLIRLRNNPAVSNEKFQEYMERFASKWEGGVEYE